MHSKLSTVRPKLSADPCVIFESRALYQISGPVRLSDEIEPPGRARLHRSGTDAVVVTWGTQVSAALEAAETMKQEGLNVGVLDLRWLSPLDEDALRAAARNASGRVIVAHEANRTGGFGAEIIARLHELLGDEATVRAIRVAAPDVRIPAAPVLQRELLPTASWIIDAARRLVSAGAESQKL